MIKRQKDRPQKNTDKTKRLIRPLAWLAQSRIGDCGIVVRFFDSKQPRDMACQADMIQYDLAQTRLVCTGLCVLGSMPLAYG